MRVAGTEHVAAVGVRAVLIVAVVAGAPAAGADERAVAGAAPVAGAAEHAAAVVLASPVAGLLSALLRLPLLRLRLLLGLLHTLLLLLLLRLRLSLVRLGLLFVPLFLLSVNLDNSSRKRNQRKQAYNSKKFHIGLSFLPEHHQLKPEAGYLHPQSGDLQ